MKLNTRAFWGYLFILPFFIMFGLFFVGPIFASFYFGLTKWSGLSSPTFIGLANYIKLMSDERFIVALVQTLWAAAVYNVIMISLAVAIALILNSKRLRLKTLFRAVYFIPVTISMSVLAIVFSLIYAPETGLLNMALKAVGLPHQFAWLDDPRLAMGSIIVMRIWRATGYYAVIILAGLAAIPAEVYEAARIDGANALQETFKITLPLLKPILTFAIIMSTIWSFQLFDEPWILNKGGPNDATLTLLQYLFQTGFVYFRLGYSSAISYMLTLIIFLITVFQLKLLERKS